LGKSAQEKKFSVTYYREEYERNNKRIRSKKGDYFKKKRSSTVEPVFGTLINYMGLRKINTIGIEQANKVMLMAAVAYNIKKYLKFITKKVISKQQIASVVDFLNEWLYKAILSVFKHFKLYINEVLKKKSLFSKNSLNHFLKFAHF